MPSFQYLRSLVVQEDVYKNVGAFEILPHLMKCLDADKILAVQFLRAGKVRLTFDDPEVCSAVLRNGLELEGLSVQLMPADDRLRCVEIRDLPVEVDNDVVSSFLSRVWSPCPSLPTFWSLPALSPARSYGQGVYAGLGPLCFCF